MDTPFHDGTVDHGENLVGISNGAEPMGDGDGRTVFA